MGRGDAAKDDDSEVTTPFRLKRNNNGYNNKRKRNRRRGKQINGHRQDEKRIESMKKENSVSKRST